MSALCQNRTQAAAWVHAICITRALATSSRGFAIRMPSISRPRRTRDGWWTPRAGATGLSLACHSIQMLLDHAQVDAEPMQVELEWRSNFQPAHGGFDLGEPSLMLGQLSFVLALRELALESSQRPVQSHDTTNGQPA